MHVNRRHHEPRRLPPARLAAAILMLAALAAVGCQTPNAATTVAPPATGMIGQPAAYGGWATPPQGAAYTRPRRVSEWLAV